MATNGGSDRPRNLEIPSVQLRSVKTSIGDNEAQSQNFVPHSSAGTPQNDHLGSEIDNLPFKRFPSVERGPRTTEVDIVGVPAIGGDPEMTWMPEAKFAQDGPSPLDSGSDVRSAFMSMTPVSPAYTMKHLPPWIVRDIRSRRDLSMARVLLYDHGDPKDGDTLKQLATRLLDSIRKLRSIEVGRARYRSIPQLELLHLCIYHKPLPDIYTG
ncbi:hypothetical protein ACHAO8_000252 [Botrytis cinerea]